MNKITDDALNQVTKAVARAGGISPSEAQTIAESPFLYARLRARIDADRQARAGQGIGWLRAALTASRAITVLLFVTFAAALAFWLLRATADAPATAANIAADSLDRVVAGGACALSTTDECAVSTEEVLAMLFAEEGRKEPK